TLPPRVAERGDPWRDTYGVPQSLEPLLALHERDMAAGLADAPWPPVYPKMPNEPPRVAPSRAKKPT
ncbi:MAG TPA: ATP-dependent DNA ligase, partial [Acidimicrobiia bacterium]|nr:ATP-dependent DNA ligase [Acidimicrobiia bacterium]